MRKATAPASATATVSSVVATGRWMNGLEIFIDKSTRERFSSYGARK